MTDSITLDYANCLAERVGEHGIERDALHRAAAQMSGLTASLNETRGTGWERWRELPFDPMRREHVDPILKLTEELRPRTENLIVLGIGGSALGNIALQSALNPATYNLMPPDQRRGPRLFVLDNVDPGVIARTIDEVRRVDPKLERTVINVISKSGETAETAAQFMVLRSLLHQAIGDSYARQIVAITDPEKGTMRSICDREGFTTLPVPDGVGGRFSVLSPVGLFSAAMCGIDIERLLDGARAMDDRCSQPDLERNPAAVLAWLLVAFTKRGKSNHVLMPYANSLYLLADWFRQLWAESLGKRFNRAGEEVFAGATPIKALGATDQHSPVQPYREGPNDKVIGLIEVARFEREVKVPDDLDIEPLRYLHGRSIADLLNAERSATAYALVESRRPNFTIHWPEINAHHVGEFLQLWMITTAYAGLLLGIDAYDQPAVETGKLATFGLMGRPGYEEWREKVHRSMEGSRDRV